MPRLLAEVPVVTWSVSPSLPNGLSIDSSTGEISGTPTDLSTTPVTYTITATNSGGSASTTIDITINDIPALINHIHGSPYTYTKSQFTFAVHSPTANGGPVTSWSISPLLPSGMSFDTSTGEISGVPTIISPTTTYTITARILEVRTEPRFKLPSTMRFRISITLLPTLLVTVNTPVNGIAANNSGGDVVSWSVSPTLPSGLTIDSTGVIGGTDCDFTIDSIHSDCDQHWRDVYRYSNNTSE